MDVVVADVSGKPVEHCGQSIKRAPLHRGVRVVPIFAAAPVGVFKLMLHIEKPNSRAAGNGGHYQLQYYEIPEAEDEAHCDSINGDSGVHLIHIQLVAPTGVFVAKALINDEQAEWTEEKQDQGVSREAIL